MTPQTARRQPGRDRPPGLPHLPPPGHRDRRRVLRRRRGRRYVREADDAVHLPGTAPADTYLRGDLIVDAARRAGADAVHPGYGFLSENAEFARAVIDAGLTWVGPAPEAIEAMGSKIEAKRLMAPPASRCSSVPDRRRPTPTCRCWSRRPPAAAAAACASCAPLADLPGEVGGREAEARRRSATATVFLEPYVERGRHIEVQVLGDRDGVWSSASASARSSAGTRRSSRRRRPRAARRDPRPPCTTPVAAAEAVGYVGAGTVEFLVDARNRPLLVPGDEHPAPGRAPGHRAGDGTSTSSRCSSWSPRGASSATRQGHPRRDRRPRDRGPALRRGPGRGLAAADRHAAPLRDPRQGDGDPRRPAGYDVGSTA